MTSYILQDLDLPLSNTLKIFFYLELQVHPVLRA